MIPKSEIYSVLTDHPYHNTDHARDVYEQTLILWWDVYTQLAAIFHDAGHPGKEAVSPQDEIQAWILAEEVIRKNQNAVISVLHKNNLISQVHNETIDTLLEETIHTVKERILATVVGSRGSLKDTQEQILADADISNLGRQFDIFFANSCLLIMEQNIGKIPSKEAVIQFFGETQPKFFDFLTDISWDTHSPFLYEKSKFLYQNFSFNKARIKELLRTPDMLYTLFLREAQNI